MWRKHSRSVSPFLTLRGGRPHAPSDTVEAPSASTEAAGPAQRAPLKFDPLARGKGKKADAGATAPKGPQEAPGAGTSAAVSDFAELGSLDDDQLAASLSKMLAELATSGGPGPGAGAGKYQPQNKDLAATLKALAEQAPAFPGAKDDGADGCGTGCLACTSARCCYSGDQPCALPVPLWPSTSLQGPNSLAHCPRGQVV